MDGNEYVILVDEHDNELGLMEKQEAHQKALLHRAFSVFVSNAKGELLLQQRAHTKYHSAGLWTNTCCSHPRANETNIQAANRRLREEMGFDCELTEKFHFVYKAQVENGLTEHELDFIYTGVFDGEPKINPEEVASYKWMKMETLMEEVNRDPQQFTAWFNIILKEYVEHLGV
jgi:isopentenyl-diphosphate delta-isomerase